MPCKKRIAVIGAGPCGLGAAKAFKEEGLEPVIFERTDKYGGLWCYRDNEVDGIASIMKTTIINTSKEMGAASDFPPPAEFPNYMHHSLMLKYIGMIAERGDVLKHVNYNLKVVQVEPTKDHEETGRWSVSVENSVTHEKKTEDFDAVAVCVGHHVFPNIPTFPGQEKFKGRILHTHALKKVDSYEDQRVVVVGLGNSGMDAAVEISNVAEQVYLSSRRGAWVLPRVGPRGHPFDASFIRRHMVFLQKMMPAWLVAAYSKKMTNSRFDHKTYNLQPDHPVWSQHPTVSDILPIKLLSGAVVVRGQIKEFTENGVIFQNETKETPVDSVVLATGYRFNFPFVSQDVVPIGTGNKVQLYKFIFPPERRHNTLAMLGLIQPSGPGFPVGEMQCRWTARVFSGKCSLPSKEEMYADIRAKDEANQKKFVDSPRHTVECDFIGFQDELAALIGAKPNFWKYAISDPKLFWALMTGPSLPYQYRLQGPNSWDGARNAILTYKDRVRAPFKVPGQVSSKFQSKPQSNNAFGFFVIIVVAYLFWSFFMKV